ncbi:MAG: hypothetical protein ABIS01_10840, partial [Ferruginibacter sp.]
MDKIILKILLRFIQAFSATGINFEKLTIIAETKILMDRRRTPAAFKQKQQKGQTNPLRMTLIIYFGMGLFIGFTIYSLNSMLLAMVYTHAYLLFMMSMTLVTDFSSVLLDTADTQIILPKPVNSRTLFVARVVHILVYLFQFTIALAIAPIIFTFIKYGWLVGMGLVVTTPLMVAFAVFNTYLLYGLMLRFANEQKIKDIVGYFQIFLTIFFAAGFQIIPRLINFDNTNYSLTLHWYSYFLPPLWMATALEALQQLKFNTIHLLMIGCTIIIPLFTVWLMVKYLAPSFSKKLALLGNVTGTANGKVAGTKGQKMLSEKLAKLVCTTKTETAGFESVWKITGRDKNFMIKFYPSLAYIAIFSFIFIFKNGKNIMDTWQGLPSTKQFLLLIYLPMLSVSASLSIVSFYDNFAASWIYQSTPLVKPGELISGTLKALLLKFFVPVYMVLCAFAFYIWGLPIVDDFIFGFFNCVLLFVGIANVSDHYLPFSRQQNVKQQTGKIAEAIFQFALIGLLVGAHYLALAISWLPALLVPFSAAGCY